MKTFLLEDQDDVATAIEACLKYLVSDVEFVHASGIKEALRILGEKGRHLDFNLAILDYELPDGFGTELMEVFRKLAPNCKVFVCSALIDADPEATRLIRRQNPDGMLSKPFTIPELKDALQKAGLL